MVSTTTTIAVRNAAKTAITSRTVRAIQTTEYTDEDARNLKNDLIAAARDVPTTLAGGDQGHTYLLESQEEHHVRTGTDVDYVEAKRPNPIKFAKDATAADIAQLREDQAAENEVFNTQEGCIMGLREAIISNVPRSILLEHFDTNDGFNRVHPRDLLATVVQNATPVTITDGRALKKERDKELTFHTDTPLAVQFAEAKRAVEQLLTLHGVTSSESDLMMTWLGDLEREKDFEDEVAEWKAKKTGKDLTTFVSFFAKRDREVRRINKIRTAAGAGYHSAANVREEDLEARILQSLEAKVETEMANLAENVTEAVARAADSDASEQPADDATAYAATASSGTADQVLTLLKSLDTRLQKIESGRSNRRQRNRQSDSGSGGDGGDGGEAKCKHCGRVHPKISEDKCWTLPENKGDAPEWFIRRLERKNKGK